ncbi:MAG: hypothetical protein NWR99_14385 [Verrucomicrobiales bacterium]|nr:hypothetical protein [Verrucomicrobiales bacterium]
MAPTIVGTSDPYNSFAAVIRARVAPVIAEVVAPAEGEEPEAIDAPAVELGSNGIPVARPVMTETEEGDPPGQRVRPPAPRAIEFD